MAEVKVGTIDNTTAPTAAPAQGSTPNESTNAPEIKKNASEQPTQGKRHALSYLAGGVWKDSDGEYWCREERNNCKTDRVYTDEQFSARGDLQFMVKTGQIKDVVTE